MNKITPTDEQKAIIDEEGNVVVLANPGSGKTTTLAFKVSKILETIVPWKGVIAISYTNKASNELKQRIKRMSPNHSNSFFGTIDRFYLSQIILPFFKSIYDISTSVMSELEILNKEKIKDIDFDLLSEDERIDSLIYLLKGGILVLDYISDIAIHILISSEDCRRYLKARFKCICVDEYQDCNSMKHNMFIKLVELGIIGVAVGDPNQSIFGFAGSNSEYLINLTSRDDFILKTLTKNRRSHEQIINYSLKFLDASYNCPVPQDSEKRFHLRNIDGNEKNIAKWIDKYITNISNKYGVENFSDIGILTLSGRTAEIISKSLAIPNKYFVSTPLDESSQYTDLIFKHIIMYIYGHKEENLENIIGENFQSLRSKQRNDFASLVRREKRNYLNGNMVNLKAILDYYKTLFSNKIDSTNIEIVISDTVLLNSYIPLTTNEVSILTTHKAKGTEYKIVFILENYKYILPRYDFENKCYASIDNDKNVHYVAITRAKEAVFFLISTIRTNAQGEEKKGIPSEFLDVNDYSWGNLFLLRTNK